MEPASVSLLRHRRPRLRLVSRRLVLDQRAGYVHGNAAKGVQLPVLEETLVSGWYTFTAWKCSDEALCYQLGVRGPHSATPRGMPPRLDDTGAVRAGKLSVMTVCDAAGGGRLVCSTAHSGDPAAGAAAGSDTGGVPPSPRASHGCGRVLRRETGARTWTSHATGIARISSGSSPAHSSICSCAGRRTVGTARARRGAPPPGRGPQGRGRGGARGPGGARRSAPPTDRPVRPSGPAARCPALGPRQRWHDHHRERENRRRLRHCPAVLPERRHVLREIASDAEGVHPPICCMSDSKLPTPQWSVILPFCTRITSTDSK
jgi:hypothetical protein